MTPAAPCVLICAGLDPSGGAGLIADIRIAAELGTRPVGVVTATTVQNTTSVVACTPLGADSLREQLEFLLSDVSVMAVKIGMLGSSETAIAIGHALALTRAPVVWDPIAWSSRGEVALVDDLLGASLAALVPHVTLVTPNARELALLVGRPIEDDASALAAGAELAATLDVAVLVKGGHLGGAESIDVLCGRDGTVAMRGARVERGEDVHGTGCALSTAIASHLALGVSLVEACRAAKAFVAARLAQPVRPGRGAAAVV